MTAAFWAGSPPQRRSSGRSRHRPGRERRRVERRRRHAAVSHLGHQVLAGGSQLVEPAGAVHHERMLGAELREHLGDRHDQRLRVDAHHLPAGAGRVRERPEQVEDAADAQLAPDRAGVAHRGVVGLREEEPEADLVDAGGDVGRSEIDPHAERLEHVGRPAPRRHGPVAVLGDHGARGRSDQRRRRRDVERVGAVAAGAAGVDQVGVRGRRRRHVGAHRPGAAGDLVGRLALHPERDQERGDLGRRGVAGHHLHHRHVRLLAREVAPLDELLDRARDHRPASMARKFSIRRRPCGVSTDSGWNCTPCVGSVRWRTPITSPSGVCAVTTSSSGMGASAASEW